jgi:hypothetical protein
MALGRRRRGRRVEGSRAHLGEPGRGAGRGFPRRSKIGGRERWREMERYMSLKCSCMACMAGHFLEQTKVVKQQAQVTL